MFRHLFLVACISFGGCGSEKKSSILARIPDIIEEFCPGVNICRENQPSQASEKIFKPGVGSCCTECSCGTECVENGNCCFPHKQTYQDDDSNGLDGLRIQRDCLLPSTEQPTEEARHLYRSYYMVSAVHENIHDCNKSVSNIPCGDENVAPWGSLYPVYSAKHKQIYKNTACANALGVTDGILWDAVLVCAKNKIYKTDASYSVIGLDSNSFPENCAVDFSYPDDIEHLRSLVCYESPIGTCSDTEFQIPDGTGISKKDVTDLCTSGFLSPFRTEALYANVFCYICNSEFFIKESVCPDLLDTSEQRSYQNGFFGLIDDSFIRSDKKDNFGNGLEKPVACSFADTSRCRPVLCPSGQLRDIIGKCKYPNKIWYDQEYTVCINLTTEVAINITDIFDDKQHILSALTSPWPKQWFIYSIFSELTDETRNYTSLVVLVKNKMPVVRPHSLVQRVKRIVIQDWLLQMNNTTIVFKPAFTVSASINLERNPIRETRTAFGNYSKSFTIPSYRSVYRNYSHLVRNIHVITKLYLCYQIELSQSDFILSSDMMMLFNTVTQRVMFDDEFILTSSNSIDGVRARICIEDSEMYQMDRHALSNACAFCKIYVLRFTVTALLIGAFYSQYIF